MAAPDSSLKILIIDDEEAVRESIRMHLEDLGYQAVAADEPAACPVYHHSHCSATERCADVIFIDQTMPSMTGLDFLKKQAERGCKLAPQFKMLMTGALTEEIRTLAAKIGCEVAQKPVRLDDITAFVLNAKKNLYPG